MRFLLSFLITMLLVLPLSSQTQKQSFAVIKSHWVAVFKTASSASERVTEVLYGEPVLILQRKGAWTRVSLPLQQQLRTDGSWGGYRGWLQHSSLITPVGRSITDYLGKQVALHASPGKNRIPVYKIANGKPVLLLNCFNGTILPAPGEAAGMQAVILPDGSRGLVHRINTRTLSESHNALTFTERFINEAKRYLGTRYLWGGTGGAGLDCSGLIHLAARTAGLLLPRDSAPQYAAVQKIPAAQARRGDLAFFSTTKSGPSHVGIFLGNGRVLHAFGKRVQISPLNAPGLVGKLLGFGRSDKITGGTAGKGYTPRATLPQASKKTAGKLYSLHISSVRSPAAAIRMLTKLWQYPRQLFIIPVKTEQGLFYALYYGTFATRKKAYTIRGKYRKKPVRNAVPRILPPARKTGGEVWAWQTMSLINPQIALENLRNYTMQGKQVWMKVFRDRAGRQWFCMLGGQYMDKKSAGTGKQYLGNLLRRGSILKRFGPEKLQ